MPTDPEKQPSIFKLNKKQYQEGATLTLQNAENLFEIAKSCHEKGFHGNGASILITALEELSKATYLQIKAHYPQIVITDLESYFYKHTVKHKAIMRLSFKSFIENIRNRIERKEQLIIFGLVAIIILVFIKENTISIQDIEKMRQSGYYVNFIKDEICWESPTDLISCDEFSDLLDFADSIFKDIKQGIFQKELTEIQMRQFIESLGDKDLYFKE